MKQWKTEVFMRRRFGAAAPREFQEWMGIVNDASRIPPLRTIVKALASAGASAGMGWRLRR
jgi:hypothetical protein